MSHREKKLLIFFAATAFIVLNFVGFGFYKAKKLEALSQHAEAQQKVETALFYQASSAQVADQIQWLSEIEPQPAPEQDVQSRLQAICENEAKRLGLTIRSQKDQPTDATEGRHYHRAKIQLMVTGTEHALYQWFDKLNVPQELRAATNILLTPNGKDDTMIDCTTTVEQWFIPLPPA